MYNQATLVGRLGKEPEQRSFQDGSPIVTFSLATSETWKKDGEKKERTQWHTVTVTNKHLCDVAMKYLTKGSLVMVVGQIEYRSWEKDGEKRYATEIALRPFNGEIKILEFKDTPTDYNQDTGELEDEIPF